jgi:Xaa-Pro aminopeptidase
MPPFHKVLLTVLSTTAILMPGMAHAQKALEQMDRLCTIRKQKFDLVLPAAMRENKIDMWIVAIREGAPEPNQDILGGDFVPTRGYFVFTDRGGSGVETAALAVEGGEFDRCGAYQIHGRKDLRTFVAERDPKRIGIDVADEIGSADGLSHSMYQRLVNDLGAPYASRLVQAEHLVSDFRSRQVPLETVMYGEAGEISRTIFERALTSEVIRPGHTTGRDVASWILDRFLERGLSADWTMPSVYIDGPGSSGESDDTIIQPGDVVSIDGGVHYLSMWMDIKRTVYVLKPGEKDPPAGILRAWDRAMTVRNILTTTIKPGRTAKATLDDLNAKIAEMPGYSVYSQKEMPHGGPMDTDVVVGAHATGDSGHGSGPSINVYAVRSSYELRPGNALSIEFFASSPVTEWGGKKLKVPIEDDAIVTADSVGWVYPPQDHLMVLR